jgi:hypothetical protein
MQPATMNFLYYLIKRHTYVLNFLTSAVPTHHSFFTPAIKFSKRLGCLQSIRYILLLLHWLLAVDRTVTCQLLSADVWVESRSTTTGILSGQTCTWTVLFLTILAFLCQRHFLSASSPYFIDLPPKTYKISNFQRCEIHHFFLYSRHVLWFSLDSLSSNTSK